MDWNFPEMVVITLVSSLGFALFFNVRKAHIATATLGGLLTWLVFKGMSLTGIGTFPITVVASTFAAIYSEILSRKFRTPIAVFFIISVIPLVPGRGLYYTMSYAVQADWGQCASFGQTTLEYAAGIAVGICLVAAVTQTWDMWRARRDARKA